MRKKREEWGIERDKNSQRSNLGLPQSKPSQPVSKEGAQPPFREIRLLDHSALLARNS